MKFWPLGSRVWISVFLFFFTLACSIALPAQTQAGRLRGQIVDATGAVIPGASITRQKFQRACDNGHLRRHRRV